MERAHPVVLLDVLVFSILLLVILVVALALGGLHEETLVPVIVSFIALATLLVLSIAGLRHYREGFSRE